LASDNHPSTSTSWVTGTIAWLFWRGLGLPQTMILQPLPHK
jgi:hypothetical protein